MRDCESCGKSIFDNEVCNCTKSTESNDMGFDLMKEALILHEKMDRIESELKVVYENIENLTKALLNHSDALLCLISDVGVFSQAVQNISKKNFIVEV